MNLKLPVKWDLEPRSRSLVGNNFVSRQAAVPVIESSQVGEARRVAVRFAEQAGLRETEQGKVAIIATEMANNLVRHARDGQLLVQVMQTPQGKMVELLSLDSGPGIVNLERCLQDGYSTGGTSGTGLGAIKRLSSEFDIHSTADVGTAILSRVGADGGQRSPAPLFAVGAVSIPMPGETVCGDAWNCCQSQQELRLMIADGLGHGPLAEEAANAADRIFDAQSSAEPKAYLEAAHKALSGTRGAAVAAACLDAQNGQLKYAGVGNIAGTLIVDMGSQGLVSHNGIVGVQRPKIQQFDYPCTGQRVADHEFGWTEESLDIE